MTFFLISHISSGSAYISSQPKSDRSRRADLHAGCTSPAVFGNSDIGLTVFFPYQISGAGIGASHTGYANRSVYSYAQDLPPFNSPALLSSLRPPASLFSFGIRAMLSSAGSPASPLAGSPDSGSAMEVALV